MQLSVLALRPQEAGSDLVVCADNERGNCVWPFRGEMLPEICINIQLVPRSKHT